MDRLSALYGARGRLEDARDTGRAVREHSVWTAIHDLSVDLLLSVGAYVCVFLFTCVCLRKSPVASDAFTQNTVSYQNMYIFPYHTKVKKTAPSLFFYSFGLSAENRKMVRFPSDFVSVSLFNIGLVYHVNFENVWPLLYFLDRTQLGGQHCDISIRRSRDSSFPTVS